MNLYPLKFEPILKPVIWVDPKSANSNKLLLLGTALVKVGKYQE